MSILKKAKVNKISKDLTNYYYLVQGVQKCGKTTFARDFIIQECNGNIEQGLLLAIGKEKGYKALDNLQALDIESWKEFDAVIKELVQGKGTDHNIKYVFIDTYDELIPLAEKEICRLSQIASGKPCKTLNSAFGGYGAGRIELRKLVTERLEMLNKHFGLIIIGHTKLKTIKEQGVGEEQEYQVMSSNLNADYHNIVAHKADVIATVVQEREVNEKRITETKTNLYFRGNGFIEAGCRFKHIEEKIEFNANNFINSIKSAIEKTSQSNVPVKTQLKEVITEVEVKQEVDIKEVATETKVEEKVIEKVEEVKVETPTQDVEDDMNFEELADEPTMSNEDLFKEIKPLYMKAEAEQKQQIKEIITSYGYKKFDLTAPANMFKEVLKVLK